MSRSNKNGGNLFIHTAIKCKIMDITIVDDAMEVITVNLFK